MVTVCQVFANALPVSSLLILPTILSCKHHHAHFTDKKTEKCFEMENAGSKDTLILDPLIYVTVFASRKKPNCQIQEPEELKQWLAYW